MTTQVEIEAKYDLPPGGTVPDLVGVAGVTSVDLPPEQELVATYHDTDDLRLTSAATTLRRRTGGADDGWHLKLPLGPGTRLEVHRPLGRSGRVPKALSTLVRAHVGGAALVPVATLTTTRRRMLLRDAAGEVVAEVADDTVRAERHGPEPVLSTWRELEVELVAGSADQLAAIDAAIRSAGVQPAGGSSKVGRVLADDVSGPPSAPLRGRSPVGDLLSAELARLTARLRAADPQFRVDRDGAAEELASTAEQLLGLLSAFRHRLEPPAADALAADIAGPLTDLARVARSAADARVLASALPDAVAAEPPELVLGPVARQVDRFVALRRRESRAAVLGALDGAAFLVLLAGLDGLAATPPLPDPAERARDALRAVTRRSLALARRRTRGVGDTAGHSTDDLADALHRLRAALAAGARVAGDKTKDLEAPVAEVVERLEEHRRTVLVRDALRLLAVQSVEAGGNGFTFGRLHAHQERAGRRAGRRLAKAGRRLRRAPARWVD